MYHSVSDKSISTINLKAFQEHVAWSLIWRTDRQAVYPTVQTWGNEQLHLVEDVPADCRGPIKKAPAELL